jgi:hypothetical protein
MIQRTYKQLVQLVRFQVLTAATKKMTVSWDVVPCSMVKVHQCSRGACCFHHQGIHPDDAGSLHNMSQGSHLQNKQPKI